MPSIPIIMPQLGESIAEATVVTLLVPVGNQVQTDEDIIEVETSKATMTLASPCPGRVERFLVMPGESYPVGTVLGYLLASPEDATRLGLDQPPPAKEGEDTESILAAGKTTADSPRKRVQPTVRGLPVPANAAGASYMSPRMKARMLELGLHAADLAGLPGSGAAGRVTIQDFEKFVANLE
jgi:pyruvate/2-oxoglutarate dehydrogenase complex dihydrolipoamide acyltransferase (E2) component